MTRDEMDAAIGFVKLANVTPELDEDLAIFIAGMGAAADIVEQAFKDGSRGNGFKYAILRVANRLSIES